MAMLQKILTVVAGVLLLAVTGSIIYDIAGKDEVTATVQLRQNDDPFNVIPQLSAPGPITQVREVDRTNNKYEITYQTRYQKRALLDWLLKSGRVEKAEVK
jgi:hypothetical protein